jgi:hypothetical protein
MNINFSKNTFNPTDTQPAFTMDTIAALKVELKNNVLKNLKKTNVKKTGGGGLGRGGGANVNRSRMPFMNRGSGLGGGLGPVAASSGSAMPVRGSAQVKVENVYDYAGPSRVSFTGPPGDAESRKKRACESFASCPRTARSPHSISTFRSVHG